MPDQPTDDDQMPECGSCRFFAAEDGQADHPSGEVIGTCHRYPPTDHPTIADTGTRSAFPQFPAVLDNEWCGEHVAAKTLLIRPPAGTVEHEPHVACSTCGHGQALHANGHGTCVSLAGDGCDCTAFAP